MRHDRVFGSIPKTRKALANDPSLLARSPLQCYALEMRDTERVLSWLLIAAALMLPAKANTDVAVGKHAENTIAQSVSASAPCASRTMMPCRQRNAQPCGSLAFGCCASGAGPSAVTPGAIYLATPPRHSPDPSFIPAILDLRRAPDPHPPRPISIG
jgi:hypothetical protein